MSIRLGKRRVRSVSLVFQTSFCDFGGEGDDYVDFIVDTLKPYIDRQLPNPAAT